MRHVSRSGRLWQCLSVACLLLAAAQSSTGAGATSISTHVGRSDSAKALSSVAEPDWLARINEVRIASGERPVTENKSWSAGIAAHLTYLEDTPASYMTGRYASAHTENPASPYFTPDGSLEGSRSDLALGGSTSNVGAINGWLTAPFHAIGILRRQLTQVAYYRDPVTDVAGLNVISGLTWQSSTMPVLSPGPDSTTYLSTFGGESPNPIETCTHNQPAADYGTAGLPLIALLPSAPSKKITANLTEPNGVVVTSANNGLCVVDANDYYSTDAVYGPNGKAILQSDHAVLIIPKTPLVAGTYTASIIQPEQPKITWSFTSDPGSVPAIPTDTSATPGDGDATLTWSPPSRDPRFPVLGYQISYAPQLTDGGGSWMTVPFDPTATSSAIVTDLVNGTQYEFCLNAVNVIGAGSEDCSLFATPAGGTRPPSSPIGVTAAAGEGQATVDWTAPSDGGGAPIVSYTATATPGDASCSTTGATSCAIIGLVNGSSYTFTVTATNVTGTSPPSDSSQAITPKRFTVPEAPSIHVHALTQGTIVVALARAVDDGGSPITAYQVSLNHAAWTSLAATSASHWSVSYLTAGKVYQVRLRALNAVGPGPASTAVSVRVR